MKAYAKLRGRMRELDITGESLAFYLGRSKSYVSRRLVKKESWDIDDVYNVLDFLDLPLSEIYTYFPPNGGVESGKKTTARRLKND